MRNTTEGFVKKAKQIYPEYDYSKVNYINLRTPISIGCPKHGSFSQYPSKIYQKHGCPKCGRELSIKKRTKSTEQSVKEMKLLHPEYDYSKVNYINNKTNIIITCPTHGDFQIKPRDFYNGGGCQKCGREQQSKKN